MTTIGRYISLSLVLLLFLTNIQPHYRAYRIATMIEATNEHTVEYEKLTQTNFISGLWKDFSPYINNIPDDTLDDTGLSPLLLYYLLISFLQNRQGLEKAYFTVEWKYDNWQHWSDCVWILVPSATHFHVYLHIFCRYYLIGTLGKETGFFSFDSPYFLLNTLANETSELCGGSCTNFSAQAFSKYATAYKLDIFLTLLLLGQ